MTVEQVYIVFDKYIDGDILNISSNQFVTVDFFAILFASAPENPTYEDLVEIDGGNMGYIPFFDQCKEEGILV